MLVMETVVRIRREHAGGKPIKEIARDLRLSRKVIHKVIHRRDRQRQLALQEPHLTPDRDPFALLAPPVGYALPTPQAARTMCPATTPASATKGSLLHADRGSRADAYLQ